MRRLLIIVGLLAVATLNSAAAQLKLSFRLERNGKSMERSAIKIPFNEASEFQANARDASNLFVEVMPTRHGQDSVLLRFAVGEIIAGKKILRSNPNMMVLNGTEAKITIQEQLGDRLELTSMVRY